MLFQKVDIPVVLPDVCERSEVDFQLTNKTGKFVRFAAVGVELSEWLLMAHFGLSTPNRKEAAFGGIVLQNSNFW